MFTIWSILTWLIFSHSKENLTGTKTLPGFPRAKTHQNGWLTKERILRAGHQIIYLMSGWRSSLLDPRQNLLGIQCFKVYNLTKKEMLLALLSKVSLSTK